MRSKTVVEANTSSFHSGGTMVAGGKMTAWAGGTYSPLPQNTDLWKQINLQQAQTLAPHLGAGVTMAVIDTGLDMNAVAFQDALTDSSTWHDFYAGGTTPQDQGQLGKGTGWEVPRLAMRAVPPIV